MATRLGIPESTYCQIVKAVRPLQWQIEDPTAETTQIFSQLAKRKKGWTKIDGNLKKSLQLHSEAPKHLNVAIQR